MSDAAITATYERKFSDGNYGSEGLSLGVTTPADASDPIRFGETVNEIIDNLRTTVLAQLARSAAPRVAEAARRELNPPAPRQPVAAGLPEPDEDPF